MFKKKKIIFTVILVLICVFCFVFFIGNYQKEGKAKESQKENCLVKSEKRIVRGYSLSPIVEPGDEIRILFGYYNCHKVEREDIVAYNYAGGENPIIKIVKGIPGDKFELKKNNSDWNILINGKVVKNSENQPYFLSNDNYKMLSLYARDYPIIPKDTYLILSNLTSGGVDSTVFGLVDKSSILGKVEK